MDFTHNELRKLIAESRGDTGVDVNDPDYCRKHDTLLIDARAQLEGNAIRIIEHLLADYAHMHKQVYGYEPAGVRQQ
jgi:hypothetical protein